MSDHQEYDEPVEVVVTRISEIVVRQTATITIRRRSDDYRTAENLAVALVETHEDTGTKIEWENRTDAEKKFPRPKFVAVRKTVEEEVPPPPKPELVRRPLSTDPAEIVSEVLNGVGKPRPGY